MMVKIITFGAVACVLLLAGHGVDAVSEYECGSYVKVGQTCDNSPSTSPSGPGELRCCNSRELTCSGDSEKAGLCCLGAFNGLGEACNTAAGK